MFIKKIIFKYAMGLVNLRRAIKEWHRCNVAIMNPKNWGQCSDKVIIRKPLNVTNMKRVFIDDYCIIQPGATLIVGSGDIRIKKYSALSYNLVIVTGKHVPTVGIPRFLQGSSRINDIESDVLIQEDVWAGANATILSGSVIGRGAMVAAGALINGEIPPYAIMAGVPAKIKGVRFSLEQIIEHEIVLYPAAERFDREYLEQLFTQYYDNKKILGVSHISSEDKVKLTDLHRKWNIPTFDVEQQQI